MGRRWWVVAALGAVCTAVGSGIVLTVPRGLATGWTAYSPLSSTPYQPPEPSWTFLLGGVLALLGAAAVGASVTGLVLQARARRSTSLGLSLRKERPPLGP